MTYNVLMGTLNPTHSLTHSLAIAAPYRNALSCNLVETLSFDVVS